jgi:hypothetical protein
MWISERILFTIVLNNAFFPIVFKYTQRHLCYIHQGVPDPHPAARAVLLGASAPAPGPDGEAVGPLPLRAAAPAGLPLASISTSLIGLYSLFLIPYKTTITLL